MHGNTLHCTGRGPHTHGYSLGEQFLTILPIHYITTLLLNFNKGALNLNGVAYRQLHFFPVASSKLLKIGLPDLTGVSMSTG